MPTKFVSSNRDLNGVPSSLAAGFLLFEKLFAPKAWKDLASGLALCRGGFDGIDAFLWLLLMFSGGHTSIKEFGRRIQDFSTLLGTAAGRKKLMTPSSLSRLLRGLCDEQVDRFSELLLLQAPGTCELLANETVAHLDLGKCPWHVLDIDPTKTGLRQRSLPHGEEMAPPNRISNRLGARGHRGRKRGQVVARETVLEHAGCGLVFGSFVAPGNGSPEAFERCLQTVGAVENLLPKGQRLLVRADGEFGGFNSISKCIERGIPLITRLLQRRVLDRPEVKQRLAKASWAAVPSSRCGPQRYAADLGNIPLMGVNGGMLTTRLVVSRYLAPVDGGKGRGDLREGQRVEVFVASGVPGESFSAADVVHLYYGRSGQENRFKQEKLLFGLEQVYSFNPAGQRFALVCAHRVWNETVLQAPRPATEPLVPDVPPGEPPALPSSLCLDDPPEPLAGGTLAEVIDSLGWNGLLRRRAGWTWSSAEQALFTGQGEKLVYTSFAGNELRFVSTTTKRQATFSLPPVAVGALRIAKGKRPYSRASSAPRLEPVSKSPDGNIGLPGFSSHAHRRRLWADLAASWVRIEISTTNNGEPAARRSAYAERQKRRLTKRQHIARYAAVGIRATVTVTKLRGG